jgi:hypothetical protein
VTELEVDRKRAMAIGAMEAMAADFNSKGDTDSAAGCFDEAARLIEAHAENAPDDASAAELRQKANEYKARSKQMRTGHLGGASGGASGGAGGDWEATWTQAGPQGQPAPAPGPGWEPFGIAFSPSDPTAPVVGWRRSTS